MTYGSGNREKTLSFIWYNKDSDNKYIGFSDGIYDENYKEIDYRKKVENNNELIGQ
jgi:hypothetical protein